jgi:hypothetical protein
LSDEPQNSESIYTLSDADAKALITNFNVNGTKTKTKIETRVAGDVVSVQIGDCKSVKSYQVSYS